jgi:hypothetical protein
VTKLLTNPELPSDINCEQVMNVFQGYEYFPGDDYRPEGIDTEVYVASKYFSSADVFGIFLARVAEAVALQCCFDISLICQGFSIQSDIAVYRQHKAKQ